MIALLNLQYLQMFLVYELAKRDIQPILIMCLYIGISQSTKLTKKGQ